MYDILLADVKRKAYMQLKSGGSRLLFHQLFFCLPCIITYKDEYPCIKIVGQGGGHLIRKGIYTFRGIELHEPKFILYINTSINYYLHKLLGLDINNIYVGTEYSRGDKS